MSPQSVSMDGRDLVDARYIVGHSDKYTVASVREAEAFITAEPAVRVREIHANYRGNARYVMASLARGGVAVDAREGVA